MRGFKLPGTAWVALITALIGWLEGDWFAGEAWVPAVVIALGAIVKALEVYADGKRSVRRAADDLVHPLQRWLFG